MTLPRVLLVEGDLTFASFVEHALTNDGYDVLRATDGLQALACLKAFHSDVVLVNGSSELVREFRSRTSVPIVLLASSDDLEERIAGLDAGADEYLMKPFAALELLARLRALRRGRALASASSCPPRTRGVLTYADLELNQDSREAFRAGRRLELRHKAFELLAYFIRHAERVLSRQELLTEVWGYEFLGDSNVIEVTVSHIRRAMESNGGTRLIRTVRPVGYILSRSRAP